MFSSVVVAISASIILISPVEDTLYHETNNNTTIQVASLISETVELVNRKNEDYIRLYIIIHNVMYIENEDNIRLYIIIHNVMYIENEDNIRLYIIIHTVMYIENE